MRIEKAKPGDAGDIMKLFKSLVGSEGCAWDDEYPYPEVVDEDIENEYLYIMRDEGRIIAAVTIGAYGELDDLDCWAAGERKPCEVYRLGVALDRQHRGIAAQMLAHAEASAREAGFDRARLLVSDKNPRAKSLYLSSGYAVMGATNRYETDWLCCEKQWIMDN